MNKSSINNKKKFPCERKKRERGIIKVITITNKQKIHHTIGKKDPTTQQKSQTNKEMKNKETKLAEIKD